MSAVTAQEIVSLIEGLIESDACMGSVSDKQVIMSLEVVSRIKANGIAPPDGMVLVPRKLTTEMLLARNGDSWPSLLSDEAESIWDAFLAAAPEVKP